MFIQSPDYKHRQDDSRFVIKNVEHAVLAGQLAENFGNRVFTPPIPFDEILYLVVHHDHGWWSMDNDPSINPADGLPYHLVKTPFEDIIKTSKASPDYNEQHSAFCGLLSSMHSYGLYNGRYGLSDAISLDVVLPGLQDSVNSMLEGELLRQQRLKTELKGSPLGDDETVFNAYKLLQFFDACAIYFNMHPAGERGETSFNNVPRSAGDDVTIHVREIEPGRYAFDPYPFRQEGLQVYCEGRYLRPESDIQSGTALMQSADMERQTMTLMAA